MKKLLFIFAIVMLCASCFYSQQKKDLGEKDSIITIFGIGGNIELPLDSFLIVKDSFVYCKEEGLWMTKELYKWNYEFPDTITVSFTRNGKFEDSVKAIRQGMITNGKGESYSPAYVMTDMIGDTWEYDINGKFIRFHCSQYPHSGRPHHYQP